MNNFMTRFPKVGYKVVFLAVLLSSFFSKYHILALNILIDLLYIITVVLIGYDIGKTVGKGKKNNHQ